MKKLYTVKHGDELLKGKDTFACPELGHLWRLEEMEGF
ncbi:MAG: hypothetical protein MW690_000092 [Methanophagales archaeon]|nr:hypothetical protein [Methanophagales archaeon]